MTVTVNTHCQVDELALFKAPQKAMRAMERFTMEYTAPNLKKAKKAHDALFAKTEFEVCALGILKYGKSNSVARYAVVRTRQVNGKDKQWSEPILLDAFPLMTSQVCMCVIVAACYNGGSISFVVCTCAGAAPEDAECVARDRRRGGRFVFPLLC